MITEHQKVGIQDKSSSKEVALELNWNNSVTPNDVKITIGDETAIVDLKDLYFFVFTAGTADMQSDLMPVRQTQVYKQIRQHRIIANKDIKRGQMIIANCEIDIPVSVVDGLRGELFKKRKVFGVGNGILIP